LQKPFPFKNLLLITPPFTQLNSPYPATAYIKGFLNTKGISAFQMDLGIEVILSLFSKEGLTEIFSSNFQRFSCIQVLNCIVHKTINYMKLKGLNKRTITTQLICNWIASQTFNYEK
jgi:hypothetical protein